MEREKSAMFLGLGLLATGIVILMFVLATVLGIAANPGPFMQRQLGGNTQGRAPTPAFAWTAQGTTVTFQDLTTSGSSAIASYAWNFGDGSNSTQANPTRTYASSGNYTVTLTVKDENGLQASAGAQVNVQNSGNNGGRSEMSGNLSFDLGNVLLPIAIAMLTFGLYVVSFLVGGSLVKAGWNLIRPRPETIRLRLKPQNWETGATAEVVPPPMMTMAAPTSEPSTTLPPPPGT
ncbi:MAG: PKD domain-containing protein [Methanobacteriota archaeon]|nr:MAG: PKD domain-containing protein [Euryarchaeota archaeon]